MQRPNLTNEEWRALANRLEANYWLIDSYDPKNGKRCWRATKWGERHYQKACMLVNVEKLFSGKTLEKLKHADFSDINASDKHLYDLGLITEVFDDVNWHDTKELTRQGFEWFYAYTKLQGRKKGRYDGNSPIKMAVNGILGTIFIIFYILAHKLWDGSKK